ncbi:MAG: glycosyltransferase [Geobacter sp.]|nr:glycosyltransferase [Geobacter sp.]
MGCSVAILLATYNGAAFLPEQLDSLIIQTNRDWCLLVSDDNSTDATPEIIASYRETHPAVITTVPNTGAQLGACRNFGYLLEQTDAPYIMFCDQDDVWLSDKIETTLQKMHELETAFGPDAPLLVHSDLRVVDHALRPVADSLWRMQKTNPHAISLNRLLMQNNATGCTMMINRALLELACPIPSSARMHDWWLMLVAGAFGHIAFLNRPTMLYRQHEMNDSGATHVNFLTEISKVFSRAQWKAALDQRTKLTAHLRRQAAEFLDRYRDRLDDHLQEIINAYLQLGTQGFFRRRLTILRYRFFYGSWLVNLGLLLFR